MCRWKNMTFPLCINYQLFVQTVVNKNCNRNYTLLLLCDTLFTIFPHLKGCCMWHFFRKNSVLSGKKRVIFMLNIKIFRSFLSNNSFWNCGFIGFWKLQLVLSCRWLLLARSCWWCSGATQQHGQLGVLPVTLTLLMGSNTSGSVQHFLPHFTVLYLTPVLVWQWWRFEVHPVMIITITVLWDVMPCSLVQSLNIKTQPSIL